MITRPFLFVRPQVKYLEQLLACVDVLLRQCDSDCGSVSLQLLQVLVTVQSLSTEPQLSDKVRKPRGASARRRNSITFPSTTSIVAFNGVCVCERALY